MASFGKSTRQELEGEGLTWRDKGFSGRIDCHSLNSLDSVKLFCENCFSKVNPIKSRHEGLHVILVIGAGKLERAKYNDSLLKWFSQCLREIGYVEDVGNQGTFKSQHDTGKNEKVLVVYPFIELHSNEATQDSMGDGQDNAESNGDEMSSDPKWLCLIVENLKTFQDMIESKMKGWINKKRLNEYLLEMIQKFEECERKLAKLLPLDDEENKIYNQLNVELLREKTKIVQKLMAEQVESKQITEVDKKHLLEQVQQKLADKDIDEKKKGVLISRKSMLESVTPIRLPLKFEEELGKLYRKQFRNSALEEKAGVKGIQSGKLTPAEVECLLEKDQVDEEVNHLESQSQFWFETEEELQSRIQPIKAAAKKAFASQAKKAANTNASGGSGAKHNTNSGGFKTVGRATAGRSYASAAATTSSSKGKASNAFASLADSDSD